MSLFLQPVRIATGSDEESVLVFADGPCFSADQQGRVWLWFERTRRPARGSVRARSPESLARSETGPLPLCSQTRGPRSRSAPGSRSKADPSGEDRQSEAKALPPESFSVLPP
jgi:hypothetical protein